MGVEEETVGPGAGLTGALLFGDGASTGAGDAVPGIGVIGRDSKVLSVAIAIGARAGTDEPARGA